MKVTLIPIVIGVLGTVNKNLVQGLEDLEIRGRVETIHTIKIFQVLLCNSNNSKCHFFCPLLNGYTYMICK